MYLHRVLLDLAEAGITLAEPAAALQMVPHGLQCRAACASAAAPMSPGTARRDLWFGKNYKSQDTCW